MTASSRTPPARSFGGCSICRARHIKCDQRRPACANCTSSHRHCDGYVKRIFFAEGEEQDQDADSSSVKSRHRQLLFDDDEREYMTMLMTSDVSLSDASDVLSEMEAQCEAAAARSEVLADVRRGPFNAFSLLPCQAVERPNDLRAVEMTLPEDTTELLLGSDIAECLESFAQDPSLEAVTGWAELQGLSVNADGEMEAVAETLLRDESPKSSLETQSTDSVIETSFTDQPSWVANGRGSYLSDAPYMLKHYVENVIPSYTPFRHQKTPWHVTFLPEAMMTLSTLAMDGMANVASLANFYGILAISALDCHDHSAEHRWIEKARIWGQLARDHAKAAMSHALDRPKAFKYKTLLMAVLTVAQLTLSDGSRGQTESWLLEAEKVVRIRGLIKTHKSRKVRMLHHCYAYMRVFHESIWLRSVSSPERKVVEDSIRQSGVTVRGQDILAFRLSSWSDLDQQFHTAKDQQHGENDLHLSLPGLWPPTLYADIFGVPETWLVLLSQIIRLANEKESAASDVDGHVSSLHLFTEYAKSLELRILRWESSTLDAPERSQTKSSPSPNEVDWIVLRSMLGALRHALAIYFYRRIYNVHPEILQSQVVKVRDHLAACILQRSKSARISLQGLLWSAFVSGCEALDEDLQTSFSVWFAQVTGCNGSCLGSKLSDTMHQVWQRRRNDKYCPDSWPHIVQVSEDRAPHEHLFPP